MLGKHNRANHLFILEYGKQLLHKTLEEGIALIKLMKNLRPSAWLLVECISLDMT